MLTEATLRRIMTRLPELRIGVVGDLFLDRYLDLSPRLTEPSVETGLGAYQVMRIRTYPGAAGTIINNLAALGVGTIAILSVIGDDGEGYELKRELLRRQVDLRHLIETPDRHTPTYIKPLLHESGKRPHELNRLDIKNRLPMPLVLEQRLIRHLPLLLAEVDALLVLDQVSEPECGVVTTAMREGLAALGTAHPEKMILADSRKRLGSFRRVWLKSNQGECRQAVAATAGTHRSLEECVRELAQRAARPVFCTRGGQGMLVAEARLGASPVNVPAYPVKGPTDPVGAGDSSSAGLACAYAAGASLAESAAFANLVASITIQQLGTTGTASPAQVWERWKEVHKHP